jgi:HEPN domain-containing protein
MPHKHYETGTPAQWLEFAKADLALAKIPLPRGTKYEQLCFLAQQAAEKSIKSVLLKLKIHFPPSHNIQGLVDLLPTSVARIPVLCAAAGMTVYATAFRYPGEPDPVTKKEYKEAIKLAEAVVEWAEIIVAS